MGKRPDAEERDGLSVLEDCDPEIYEAIKREEYRQSNTLELIASENFTSAAVRAAQGSVLTNKYAEGYPQRRYYGGCECVDMAESLAIERACALFKAEHANVQPHSGSQANMAAYFAVARAGDLILGMELSHGGHLSHGSTVNFSGKLFHVATYGVTKDSERIDYDEMVQRARQLRPRIIIAGASAYPRTIDFAPFAEVAREVGAVLIVDMAHIAGLVATGLHPNPVPLAEIVTSTTHKTLRGPRGGMILCREQYADAVDKAIFPGTQGGPLMHVIAAKAVAFKEALQPEFVQYQRQVVKNARAMAQRLEELGYRLVAGGTDTHLLLVDLRGKGITGKDAEEVLDKAGITVNKNKIPYDPAPATVTSGIRIGTPGVTTRGMKEQQMHAIVDMIDRVLSEPDNPKVIMAVREEVKELCRAFPVPG